eukprot:15479416-Alexandrium_andersonii.AAC.1
MSVDGVEGCESAAARMEEVAQRRSGPSAGALRSRRGMPGSACDARQGTAARAWGTASHRPAPPGATEGSHPAAPTGAAPLPRQ